MPAPTILGKTQKFLGNTVGEAAGFAAGLAVAPALHPELQDLINKSWSLHRSKPLDAEVAAAIAAEDVESLPWAITEAGYTGVDETRLRALWGEALNAPGLGTLQEAWRRGFITDADFDHGLAKAKLEARWTTAMHKLKTRLIDLEPIASGIQRGLLPAPFPLPFDSTPGAGRIPSFPTSTIDPVATAEGLGYTTDDLFLLTALAGNPPGPEALFRAQFRGAIDQADVERGLLEGRARGEWFPAYEADARAIPTPHDYVEHTLRGYADPPAMTSGAARHGMSPEDVQILFDNAGRPLAIHQITTGLARGGQFHPEGTEQKDPFQAAVRESSIKPAYYDLAIANRYTMPSVFAIRGLAQSHVWDEAKVRERLLWSGWIPEDAADVAKAWTATEAGGLSPAVKSAQTRFITAIHKAYVGGGITEDQMVHQLTLSELSAADQSGVAAFYRKERALELIPPPPAA